MAKRWLITGATGLLSDYLIEACGKHGAVTTTARSGGDRRCDLIDRVAVRSLLSELAPDVVVHAAGLTDVDRCEREPDQAYAANRDAGGNIAAVLAHSARLVFVSTDQVYPDIAGPHAEDAVGPVNVYGRSKLAGEQAVLQHPGALVLRTNFFGPSHREGRASLSDFVIRSLIARQSATFFSDILFSPLHMATLGALVVGAAERGMTGVFNAGCRDGASKADFAMAVARHKGLQTETSRIGSSSVMPDRAKRPKDMRMAVGRIEQALGRPMPTLDQEIAKL
jgi:dTDP-4-dehydrorhamnose reductase